MLSIQRCLDYIRYQMETLPRSYNHIENPIYMCTDPNSMFKSIDVSFNFSWNVQCPKPLSPKDIAHEVLMSIPNLF